MINCLKKGKNYIVYCLSEFIFLFQFDPKPLGNLTLAGAGIKSEVKSIKEISMDLNAMEDDKILTKQLRGKYPDMGWDFQSTETSGLYYCKCFIRYGAVKCFGNGILYASYS